MPWRAWFCVAGWLLVITGIGCNNQSNSSREQQAEAVTREASEEARFEPGEVDVGSVPLGMPKDFVAELVNYGQTEVKVSKVQSSCGCMDVRIDKAICGPGNRVRVHGQIRTGEKAGLFRQTVKIFEAGDGGRVFVLQIVGDARPEIQLLPDSVTLHPSLLQTESSKGSLRIRNCSESAVHVQQPVGLPEGIEVAVAKRIVQPGEEGEIFVLAAPIHVRDEDYTISIPITHPREPAKSFIVHIRPEQCIQVSPQAIRLGVVAKKHLLDSGGFTLRLAGQSLSTFRVLRIKAPPFLRVAKQVTVGEGLNLHFGFVDKFSGLDLSGRIVIDVNWKGREQIPAKTFQLRVPVSGILQDG